MTSPSYKRRKLGELLIAEGLLTEEQLNQALARQHRQGGRLGTILLKLGIVTEEAMIRALGVQMGIQHLQLSDVVIDQEVVKLVPEQIARRYQVIPLFRKERVVTLAMVDPLNVFAIDAVRQATGLDVQPVVSREQDVLKSINRYYSITSSMERVVKSLDDSRAGNERRQGADRRGDDFSSTDAYRMDELGDVTLFQPTRALAGELKAEDAPVIKFVNMMMAQAVREGASDIHLEPDEDVLRLRYRIDGMLREVMSPPRHLQAGITSRIKIMANIDIAEKRVPQDGGIQLKIGRKDLDIRVSTLPTVFGEKVVMRILDKSSVLLGLEESGFTDRQLLSYRKLIRRPFGLILVTGPTGSGKSTTLYASLQEINSIDKNIVTIEDPVEYQLRVINQVQVNPKAGVTFANGLRSILRQDPDIIMIGEIRDKETATIAIQSALTGHLVFSTLHTNDAPSAVTRLVDMGVEPFLIASTLSGVVAQRLVRQICRRCQQPYTPPDELLHNLKLNGAAGNGAVQRDFKHGAGCQDCRESGYAGRIGIFELLAIDDEIRSLIVGRASAREIQAAAKQVGFTTLREDGLVKATKGHTTLEEVLRVTQEIDE